MLIASDRSSDVLKGLNEGFTDKPKESSLSFGSWSNHWRLWEASIRQYTLLSKEQAIPLSQQFMNPTGYVIADPTTHISILRFAHIRNVCMIYLHMEHQLALDHFIRPLEIPVSVLSSRRRGTCWESLFPPNGHLWKEITEKGPTASFWICDNEVFPQPQNQGRIIQQAGSYGKVGIWAL